MDDTPFHDWDEGDPDDPGDYDALVIMLRSPSYQNSRELRELAAQAIEELVMFLGEADASAESGIRNFEVLSRIIHEKDAEIQRLKVIIAWKVDPPT